MNVSRRGQSCAILWHLLFILGPISPGGSLAPRAPPMRFAGPETCVLGPLKSVPQPKHPMLSGTNQPAGKLRLRCIDKKLRACANAMAFLVVSDAIRHMKNPLRIIDYEMQKTTA